MHSTVRSRPLCYRAATDADQPRAAPAPPTGAPESTARTDRHRSIGRSSSSSCSSSSLTGGLLAGSRRAPRRGRVQPLRGRPARPRAALTNSSSSSRRSSTTGPARSSWPASASSSARSSPSTSCRARSRRHDRDRGQGLLEQPGFDPVGIVSAGLDTISGKPRGASTITQQLVRARLLPPEAFEGSTYERKVREIIQSVRLTQAYPGEAGKQQIITAYLNQNFYGNQSYGVKAAAKGYFGKSLADLTLAQDAILAAIPQSPTKFDLVRNAEEVCLTSQRRRRRGVHQLQARRPAGLGDRPAAQQGPRPDEDAQPADRRQAHRGRVRRGQGGAGRARPARCRPTGRRRISCGRSAAQLGQILCPDTPDRLPRGRHRRLPGHHDARLEDAEDRREVGLRRGPRAQLEGPAGASCASRKIPAAARTWILGLRGHNINNAAAAVIDYRTGEILAYAGSASYTSKGNKKFQPQFDVLADGWRQPGSAIKPVDYAHRHRRQDADRLDDVHGRHHELRGQLHPDPGRQARARPGPPPLGAPVLAQHPGHQGDDHHRPRPRLRADQGLRADLSEHRRPGPVDGHRHPRGPPDRPARAPTGRSPTAACRMPRA